MSAAEVLALHATCSCGEWAEDSTEHAQHQLDALKAAGYAVVELPKVEINQYGETEVQVSLEGGSSRGYNGVLRVDPGGVNHRGQTLPTRIATLQVPTPTEVPDARSYAAALLAIADAAESLS